MAEEEHKKSEEKQERKKNKNSLEKCLSHCKKNYWIISTLVLAILLILILVWPSGINKDTAGQKVISFIESRGGSASLVSIEKDNGMYLVTVSVEGQEVPVYVTKDGKNLIPSLIPLEITSAPDASTDTTPQQQDIPKSDKPIIELFIMSYCPYGTQIEKGIIPVVNALGNKIDFKLKFVYYAMHPTQGEVEENTREYCIQKEQTGKFIPYLTCFLQAGDSDSCLTQAGVNKAQLNTCYNATDKQFDITKNLNDKSSWLSGQFPKYNVNLEENNKYQVGGSPTLIINGADASSGRDPQSLLNTICSSFNTAPEECSQQLDSAQPSAGFGFSTTGAATANTAQCG